MTPAPHPDSPPAPHPYRRLRVPPFYPVPVRTRRDGWTVWRQADFLGMLAETGSVIGACEAVGMSRKSAYRLRGLPGAESFAAAWDAALGMPVRMVTAPARGFFGCNPRVHLVTFRGRYRGAWCNAADGALLEHIRRPGRAAQGDSCRPEGDSGAGFPPRRPEQPLAAWARRARVAVMDFDDLLHRYFGTTDLAEASPAVREAGIDKLRVDFGLETDRGRRFALWALLYLLGQAPDLDVAFEAEEDREAARDLMDLLDSEASG